MIETQAKKAKVGAKALALLSPEQKNRALNAIAALLIRRKEKILEANAKDLEAAKNTGAHNLDRLSLQGRIDALAEGVTTVARLQDPIGEVMETKVLPNGLKLSKVRVPIGVIGVIYEARPNVTVDVAALFIKSGNGAVLRGSKDALRTNRALIETIREGMREGGIDQEAVQFIDSPERGVVEELLLCDRYIDMIIPRGNAALHTFCKEKSRIPVITGGIGICHLFVDKTVDEQRAIEVIVNAKTQRPTVCNALDTLLVHEKIASSFVPKVVKALMEKGVLMRMDEGLNLIEGTERIREGDFDREWLTLALGIKSVESVNDAIVHIGEHSTGHSDGILTEDREVAERFLNQIDSSAVFWNASTRFNDGGEFGFGAEVAISTQKLHARGPMGLKELTSYKWVIEGNYHVRKG